MNLEGEEQESEMDGSFSKASIPKRMAIILAGATVNIIFAIIVFYILIVGMLQSANPENSFINNLYSGLTNTGNFIASIFDSYKMIFTGEVGINDFMGPIGISEVVANTAGFQDYIYIVALISLSLGVTNLFPIPALDGGKFVLLVIELIRRKKLSEKVEMRLQLIGFVFLITLSLYVAYNDILRFR